MKQPGPLSSVRSIDNALSPRAIRELRRQIVATFALTGGTIWYALDTPPRTYIEQVIQCLRDHVPDRDDYVGAEWWSRAQKSDSGFPFHFDRDEAIKGRVVCPDMSSIVYLSEVGGPTLVIGSTPSNKRAPRVGVAVQTHPGRFAMFPGNLLHGVLPGPPTRWPRITLLVNWWRSRPKFPMASIPRKLSQRSRIVRAPGIAARPTRPREPPQPFDAAPLMPTRDWLAILARASSGYRR